MTVETKTRDVTLERLKALQEFKTLVGRRELLFPLVGDLILTIANNVLYLVEMIFLVKHGYSTADISALLVWSMGAFAISLVAGGYVVDKIGFRRSMTLSLLIYAVTPALFYFLVSYWPGLVVLAVLSGFNSAIAMPAASVYTYSVIDRKQLGRLFMPLYILSGVGWIGYYIGTWLLDSNTWLAFALGSVLVVVATGFFNFGLRDSELVTLKPPQFLIHLAKFTNRKFALLALLIFTILSGSILFNFLIPMSLIQEAKGDNAQTVGILMSSAFALAMVLSLLFNQVFHIQVTNLRYVLLGNVALALTMALAGQHLMVTVVCWACFLLLALQANVVLFSKLWAYIDVQSGTEQAIFQSLNTITAFLMYLIITLLIDKLATMWIYLGYAILTLICWGLSELLRQEKGIVPDLASDSAPAEPAPQSLQPEIAQQTK